jgi:hypothetical protein
MKMSWGNKLMFVFIAFAALMGTLVYKAVNTRFDLVSKDYYKDELRYQEQIDATKNASEITAVQFEQGEKDITINFPPSFNKRNIEADIWFYCKADSTRDKKLNLKTTTASLSIAKKDIFKGNFEVKVRWTVNGKNYYTAKDMTVL